MNLGEQRFAWLLTQRGIPFCRETNLEDCIQVREKRPDFCAQFPGFPPILAEVKEKPQWNRGLAPPGFDPTSVNNLLLPCGVIRSPNRWFTHATTRRVARR